MLKVDGAKDVPAAALKTILKLVPQPGARKEHDYAPAMDAAAAESFATRFPHAADVKFA